MTQILEVLSAFCFFGVPENGRPSNFSFKERGGHPHWQREWKYSGNLLGLSRRGELCSLVCVWKQQLQLKTHWSFVLCVLGCFMMGHTDTLCRACSVPLHGAAPLLGQRTQPAASNMGPANSAVSAAVTNPVCECSLPAKFALPLLWGVKCHQELFTAHYKPFPPGSPACCTSGHTS